MSRQVLGPLGKSRERLLILGLILTGWALIVVIRLFDLQVLAHDKYTKLGEAQQEELEPVEAPRGAIVDRNGNYLAISSPSQLVVVNPGRIPDKALAAALLGRVLNLPAEKLQADFEDAAASKHRRGYFVVDPRVSDEKAETLRAMKLDWLEIRQGSLRTYPNGQLAAHVIGNVGADGHGAAGVERKLDKELAGTPGLLRVKVDVKRRPYDSEVAKAPVIGKNIGLTIDSQIQESAEDALKEAVEKNHADHGSVIAIDPRNGEILALANYPTYDLNERLHAGEKPVGRSNLAVVAPYEPGSVMKVITLSAALETTNLRPQTIIPCAGGVITLFGRTIHDAEKHGDLSMEDVLAMSSNVGAIHIGMQVGSTNLYGYERRFGIGGRTGIELPAEAPGLLRKLSRWQATSLPSVAFGHELSVTTLQLARVGSVFANGGFLIYPHVIAWKQAPSGPKELVRPPAPTQVLKPETVMTMRQMMQRVITSPHGTAHTLHLVGYTLAGKTGTAQIFDFDHKVYTHKYNASFMGFAPMNNPSFLIVVTISGTTGTAGFGAYAAGPPFQSIANTALRIREVPRDVPEEVEELAQKELAAKEKLKQSQKPVGEADPLAALSTPPSDDELREATTVDPGDENSLDAQSQVVANVAGPKVPDFAGKTVKESIEEASAAGIELDIQGDGLARAQYPAAGRQLISGERVRVRFSR
jgi:cell division protein FtsI (penicillin-binding protein 3)